MKGEQGNLWRTASIRIKQFQSFNVEYRFIYICASTFIHSNFNLFIYSFKIVFEAVVGEGHKSDIAIDGINNIEAVHY